MRVVFRNVLVGVDGSPAAERALDRAIDVARASGGRIGLLAAVPAPSAWISIAPFALPVSRTRLTSELEAEAKRHVDEAERRVPADVPVTKLVAHGGAAEALITHALDGPWDLVVLGHRSSSDRLPVGRRVGARLLRSSPVPVLVVREVAEATTAPAQAARAPERSSRHPGGFRLVR